MSYVLHVNYRFAPKWNLFAKGMYETASVYKASDEVEKGKYRKAWGYAGGRRKQSALLPGIRGAFL